MRKMALLVGTMLAGVLTVSGVALMVASMKPAEAAFPGRNGDIVFTSRDTCTSAAIARVRPDGTGLTPLTCDPVLPAFAQYPAWSKDGKKIAFQLDPDDETPFSRDLWVMRANGEHRINITNTPHVDEWQPAWFPSGNKIAYARMAYANDRNDSIEVATLGDNGKVAKTTRLTADGSSPAIPPDGKMLAFVSDPDGDAEIYVMRADIPEGPNNKPRKLTDNATYRDDFPDFSPDGSKIVYDSIRGGNWDVFVMKADGSGKKNLTRNSASLDAYPAFSPDGRYVVFSRGNNLWKMRADGSHQTPLTSGANNYYYQPDWRPRP